ncbi:MAG: hypothetical protein RIB46_15985 [Pseudomonadales bacterium]
MSQYVSPPALGAIFSSKGAERVLLYLQNYGDGYAKAIADTFGMSLSQVQNQLQKFEAAGVLVSRTVGSARIYYWNQRNPTVGHLREFLQRALDDLPRETVELYFRQRRRPRRPAKRSS